MNPNAPVLPIVRELTDREATFFRDQLKKARAEVLADAEAYAEPLNAMERLARFLNPKARTLGKARGPLEELAGRSPLARDIPERRGEIHQTFATLFDNLREARNDAMHIGARARHLTSNAVEVCLILEDGLQTRLHRVRDFKVKNPVTIEPWQPVSFARQQMLEHSFTYLPTRPTEDSAWVLIADYQVAQYLRGAEVEDLNDRLAMRISEALAKGLTSLPAPEVQPEHSSRR